jgi:hypothetical protein
MDYVHVFSGYESVKDRIQRLVEPASTDSCTPVT